MLRLFAVSEVPFDDASSRKKPKENGRECSSGWNPDVRSRGFPFSHVAPAIPEA